MNGTLVGRAAEFSEESSPLLQELQDNLRDDRPGHHEDEAVHPSLHLRDLSFQAAQPLLGGRAELGGGYPHPSIGALIRWALESRQGAFEGSRHTTSCGKHGTYVR